MGVRDPGFRVLTYELSVDKRSVYLQVSLQSGTEPEAEKSCIAMAASSPSPARFWSTISYVCFFQLRAEIIELILCIGGTVPVKLVTGLVILHAEK